MFKQLVVGRVLLWRIKRIRNEMTNFRIVRIDLKVLHRRCIRYSNAHTLLLVVEWKFLKNYFTMKVGFETVIIKGGLPRPIPIKLNSVRSYRVKGLGIGYSWIAINEYLSYKRKKMWKTEFLISFYFSLLKLLGK